MTSEVCPNRERPAWAWSGEGWPLRTRLGLEEVWLEEAWLEESGWVELSAGTEMSERSSSASQEGNFPSMTKIVYPVEKLTNEHQGEKNEPVNMYTQTEQ